MLTTESTMGPIKQGQNTEYVLTPTTESALDLDPDCKSLSCLINLKNRTLDDKPVTRGNMSEGTYVALGFLGVLMALLIIVTVVLILKRCILCTCQFTWSYGEQSTVQPTSVELTTITHRGRPSRSSTIQQEQGTHSAMQREPGSHSAPHPFNLFQTSERTTSALASCPEMAITHC